MPLKAALLLGCLPMTRTIPIDEFPARAREHLSRVVEGAETIVLVDNNRPVAEIRPMPKPRTPQTLAEIFESLPHLTPEEAEAFGRDVEESRRWLNQVPLRDPWQD
jgi:antitoxin (DNA-binding transcriptional repressor) of toxin-antitoxin stability system